MVRLTLARKIAAITLTLWKKGERSKGHPVGVVVSLRNCG